MVYYTDRQQKCGSGVADGPKFQIVKQHQIGERKKGRKKLKYQGETSLPTDIVKKKGKLRKRNNLIHTK